MVMGTLGTVAVGAGRSAMGAVGVTTGAEGCTLGSCAGMAAVGGEVAGGLGVGVSRVVGVVVVAGSFGEVMVANMSPSC